MSRKPNRPILNSEITYVKETPKFLQALVGKGPTVRSKVASQIRVLSDSPVQFDDTSSRGNDDNDIYRADEEPSIEGDPELIRLLQKQMSGDNKSMFSFVFSLSALDFLSPHLL